MILLLDKSLSMAPYFAEVKAYVATQVIEPTLVPGDRLIVELVYGKVERLLTTRIGSEAEKAAAIRALRSVRADGHYTDLGRALDAAKKDLDELGQAERPKYVLLVTDERQEAPKGSPYAAPDYKLRHPSLEYIKRLDLGRFRVITVGLQVKPKVEKAAPAVMQLLMDAPLRRPTLTDSPVGQAPASSSPSSQHADEQASGSSPAARSLPAWLLYGAGALLVVALAGLAALLVLSKKKDKQKEKTTT
jgi:hypothetical protein